MNDLMEHHNSSQKSTVHAEEDDVASSSSLNEAMERHRKILSFDDYDRWIPMLMEARGNSSPNVLAKLIYQDDPTRWKTPKHISYWMQWLHLHCGSLTRRDPNETAQYT